MIVTQTFNFQFLVGGAYTVDGVNNGPITLQRGLTYKFQIDAVGHPLYIQTTGNGYVSGNVWQSGVSGNGTESGTLTFTVPADAPDTLYYQCLYHPIMFGRITIVDSSVGQSFMTVDPYSDTLEDLVDKVFYGVKQDIQTGAASIDTIAGDATVRLPDQYSLTGNDYINWMWSYNRFLYSYDPTTGHLLMEVL
jgi:hypothetical protein